MERTFSFEARAVVPTTQGLTSATPSAGRMRMKPTNSPRGTALRTGERPALDHPFAVNFVEEEGMRSRTRLRQGHAHASVPLAENDEPVLMWAYDRDLGSRTTLVERSGRHKQRGAVACSDVAALRAGDRSSCQYAARCGCRADSSSQE